ncbi:MAG: carboxypeptidase-like regulatory domain-containing protein, partial [Bacteroidales bacterium]|nr:carboxypeptidase-like regulatory domain-containing protein [Bacteroidales bacterium]
MNKVWITAIFAIFGIKAYSQVSGYVKDAEGSPLMGATIYWEGTSKGSTTNEQGHFTIKKSKGNDTLVVSYMGYSNQQVVVVNDK